MSRLPALKVNIHLSISYKRSHCLGYLVAQVRALFRVHLQHSGHPLHRSHLAYVQFFSPPYDNVRKQPNMCVVSRQDGPDHTQRGQIVNMESIARFVQLVPKFGRAMDPTVDAINSMDIHTDYFLNSFADKEIYQSVW
jgi:hypothetical protein